MNKQKGLFIAVEGIDGMGKSTQLAQLEQFLAARGFDVKRTREPTDSVYGREIRRIAQEGRDGISPDEEVNLFLKDRELDVRENILPALEAGEVVLVDRYYYSNMAYQGALGIDPERIRALNAHFPKPDLVIMLDASPATGIGRIRGGRGETNNQGYEQEDFLAKVRAIFAAMPDDNIVRIDASRDLEAVTGEVRAHVLARLSPPPGGAGLGVGGSHRSESPARERES
ncbi:MAG TPA: dTMP kinase [Pantanalinema sp.]